MLAIAVVLIGCDGVRPDPDAEFRDGRYVAAYAHTRADGWRPFLELRVRAGLLHTICFDAIAPNGTRLMQSDRKLEEYRLATGVDLPPYIQGQIDAVIAAQDLRISADPQALEWSLALFDLLRQVIPAARVGLTVEAAGVASVPTNEPYLAADLPDELGWRAELVVVYYDQAVAAVDYAELREQSDGSAIRKRDQPDIQADYERLLGLTSASVAQSFSSGLVVGDVPDAVAGATISLGRFTRLTAAIEASLIAADLPDRPCR